MYDDAWEPTVYEQRFQLDFTDYTIQIESEFSEELGETITLRILDNDNRVIEQVTEGGLREIMDDAYKAMGELYAGARRIATGVDAALDTLLEELE